MGLNILKGYLWSDYMIENIDEETYLFKSKVNAKDIDLVLLQSKNIANH